MLLNWKPSKVFYGWWIVGGGFLITLYIGGVIFFGFTAVFEPIANEFGWSYTQISLAASLRGLEMGLLAPLTGFLVDRWGPRRLIFGGAIITGLGLILLSRINSLGMFYGAFVLIAFGLSTCSQTVLMTAVAHWFRRRIATAAGIVVSGFGLGGLLILPVAILIDTFEWRTAMAILGIGMWGIVLPLSFLIRHKPEQYGYLPDGEVKGTIVDGGPLDSAHSAEAHIRTNQALTSRAFWHITLIAAYQTLVVGAVVTHVMPYLSTIGIARSASSLVASAVPVTSVGGRLGFGWLGDKLNKKWLVAICLALITLGLLLFDSVSSRWMWLLVPFIILFGIGWGGIVTLRIALLRESFGTSRLGTILGFSVGVTMLGSIAGATLAGWVFDTWHSYDGIWFVLAGLGIAASIIMLTIPSIEGKFN